MQQVDYDQISKIYDDVREGDIALINCFLQKLPSSGALRILDIGCGTGNYTDLFQRVTQERGFQVFGVEPSEGMLEKARRKNSQVVFQQGSADHIPAVDDFFDFIYMTDVIHHVPDIRQMFAEMRRVLKPQGKVCILTQSHQQIEERWIVRYFPGTARVDKARYPEIDRIVAAAQNSGLRSLGQETLLEGQTVELGADYLELVRKKGYSMLHLLTEAEYQQGLERLELALKNGPVGGVMSGETLVWLEN